MPVSDTLANPTAEPNTWKADVLDPWVDDVSDTIATLEAIPSPAAYVSPTRKNLSYHYSGNLQTAIDDHATWGELWVPSGTYNHSTPVEEPVGIGEGKTITGENREDSIINHTGTNQPILIQRDGAHSVTYRNLQLAYSGQQTNASHPNSRAIALQRETGDPGYSGYWRRWQSLRIHQATIAIGVLESEAGFTGAWGTVFDDILITETSHMAIDLTPSAGGSPSNTFNNLQVHNSVGLVPTGTCIALTGVEAVFINADIEFWNGSVGDFGGGSKVTMFGTHVESHRFSGATPRLFLCQDGQYQFFNPWYSFLTHNVSSFGAIYYVSAAGLISPNLRLTMQAAVDAGFTAIVHAESTMIDAQLPGYQYLDTYSVSSPFLIGSVEGFGFNDTGLGAVREWGSVAGGAYHQGTIASSATIDTSRPSAYVSNAGNVTGIILEAGVIRGQRFTVINDGSGSVTFATDATSNVLGGTGVAVAADVAKDFVWYPNGGSGRWWPV